MAGRPARPPSGRYGRGSDDDPGAEGPVVIPIAGLLEEPGVLSLPADHDRVLAA